ncbi:MAG: hypothetical protein KDD89_05080 [Anaerolineales bacterium]|nr:hypothetical protein [Anaerolineales bacterium]
MSETTLPIPVTPQIAQAYYSAPSSRQAQMQTLIALLLQEFVESTAQSLFTLMDEMSREAAENGLDEAGLALLLQEDD